VIEHTTACLPLDFLACPGCGGALARPTEDDLACFGCGARFTSCEGIPVLSRQAGYHFMRPTAEQLSSVFRRMDAEGFDAGMDSLYRDVGPEEAASLREYMLSEMRAAWRVLLPPLAGRMVLDFGSGWGNLAVGLARSAGRVVGMDLSLQRVRFAVRRAAHEGLANLDFVAGGDGDRLPFADGTFDVAILNGVLEWIPTTMAGDADPRDVQVRFLRELARVTKPDGRICIAIENRFGLKYWMRAPDEHTQLRFITLLPRWLAGAYSRYRRGRPYREYTHSMEGYRRLVRDGGFPESAIWIPYPEYREYDVLVPADAARDLARVTRDRRRIVRWMGAVISRVPRLANSYVVLAAKRPAGRSRACWQEAAAARGRFDVPWGQALLVLGTGALVAVAKDAQAGSLVVVKLPLDPTAAAACRKAGSNLEALLADPRTPVWLRGLMPRPLGRFAEGHDEAFVQQRLPGSTGVELAAIRRQAEAFAERAETLLRRWHLETARRTLVTEELYATLATPLAARGLALIARHDREVAARAAQAVQAAIVGLTLPLVQSHGDYWLKNLLLDDVTGEILGIIDWDRAQPLGLPLLDLLHLDHTTRRLRLDPGFHAAIASINDELATEARYHGYRTALGLDIKPSRGLLALYVLSRLPGEVVVATEAESVLLEGILPGVTSQDVPRLRTSA